jgi:hypothetical protein
MGGLMVLGELIEFLKQYDPEKVVPLGFHKPHSYRGYYDHLAFEPAENITVGAMLAAAESAVGTTYPGYKGGEYEMGLYTDVWLSRYGYNDDEKIGWVLMKFIMGDQLTIQDLR